MINALKENNQGVFLSAFLVYGNEKRRAIKIKHCTKTCTNQKGNITVIFASSKFAYSSKTSGSNDLFHVK